MQKSLRLSFARQARAAPPPPVSSGLFETLKIEMRIPDRVLQEPARPAGA